MLQVFTGVSKVERRREISDKHRHPKNPDNKADKTNRQKKLKMKKVLDKETKLVYKSASSEIVN
ncbi:MAG TPA: hypothetical protein VIH98_05885 [Xanthobacteraceae bacterium]